MLNKITITENVIEASNLLLEKTHEGSAMLLGFHPVALALDQQTGFSGWFIGPDYIAHTHCEKRATFRLPKKAVDFSKDWEKKRR